MNPKSTDRLRTGVPWYCDASATAPSSSPADSAPISDTLAKLAARLQGHADRLSQPGTWDDASLRGDPSQVFLLNAAGITVDASRQAWDDALRRDLTAWSQLRGLEKFRADQFAGKVVNQSEARAARHSLLRAPDDILFDQGLSDLAHTREQFLDYAEQVRRNPLIRHLIHVGIGGSDLGPRLLVQALTPHQERLPSLRIHFAGNGDLHELEAVLQDLDPLEVQIVLCSKSFTTPETLVNAYRLQSWMETRKTGLFALRCIAITSNEEAAASFGIRLCFAFPDWVGGRYSLWSPIGFSLTVAIGKQGFLDLLAGAWEMDCHWLGAEPLQNMAWQLGLLDFWNRSALHYASRCVVPYDSRLARLPAYLQQLEMESNGKSVEQNGNPLTYHSGALVWGEPGTNAQHSLFQWLHQGTDPTPVEFLLVAKPDHPHQDAHRKLLSNALAQSLALLRGKSLVEAETETVKSANPIWSKTQIAKHRVFSGGRPSTILSIDALNPRSLGALIALYEHRVAVSGFLWGVNSFDQWGVELGKQLAVDIERHMVEGMPHPDAQTERWIGHFRAR